MLEIRDGHGLYQISTIVQMVLDSDQHNLVDKKRFAPAKNLSRGRGGNALWFQDLHLERVCWILADASRRAPPGMYLG